MSSQKGDGRLGLTDRFSKAVNSFLSPINENNIYEWIMSDYNSSEIESDPIIKKAISEYHLYLANMSKDEKRTWELYHQKGKEMAYEALKKYRDSEVRRMLAYFSLENTPEVNDDIFARDTKRHAEIFNNIREYFRDKPYDRQRAIVISHLEGETVALNRYWKNAREHVLAENQKMKELLKITPEELVKTNVSVIYSTKFNSGDVLNLKKLEEKYFNDPYVNAIIKRIEEVVSETEQLRKQIENKWREEREKRGLKIIEGKNIIDCVR